MEREFLQGLMEMPEEVAEAILQAHGQAMAAAAAEHEKALAQVRFDHDLADAIRAAGGRNEKAITALLDVDALKDGGDVAAAVAALKKECGYLFESPLPPPYAKGTGVRQAGFVGEPQTLADALRERFRKK